MLGCVGWRAHWGQTYSDCGREYWLPDATPFTLVTTAGLLPREHEATNLAV